MLNSKFLHASITVFDVSNEVQRVVAGRAAESPRRVPGSDGSSRARRGPPWSQPALPYQDQTPPGIALPGSQQGHSGVSTGAWC